MSTSLEKSFSAAAGGQRDFKKRKTHHCFIASLGINCSSFLVCYLIFNLWSQQKACLELHRCWTKSYSIDFGIWPKWWHHYVDWISVSLIKMLYVESQRMGRTARLWKRRKRKAIGQWHFLVGHKHYGMISWCLFSAVQLDFINTTKCLAKEV